MKLVVFAHTPPPHHGQSYMVAQMLAALGPEAPQARIDTPAEHLECFHINARLSDDMEDVGRVRFGKIFRLLGYCWQAIRCRFRTGARVLYYVPAPGKRGALYRDWIVMLLCRPFFDRLVLHWHAVGLGMFLDERGNAVWKTDPDRWIAMMQINMDPARPWERGLTQFLLGRADVSVVLAEANREDAAALGPKVIEIVPNGIPDPCPQFENEIVPLRKARTAARLKWLRAESSPAGGSLDDDPRVFRLLFLAHCREDKGLLDTLKAVEVINQRLQGQGVPLVVQLTVAGGFQSEEERAHFDTLCGAPEMQMKNLIANSPALLGLESVPMVRYLGFVSGKEKHRLFTEADAFCFPTYYFAESFGLVVLEAMAYGLPVISTKWRAIPEIMPPGYRMLVQPGQAAEIVTCLEQLVWSEYAGRVLRDRFLAHFTAEHHIRLLRSALLRAEE